MISAATLANQVIKMSKSVFIVKGLNPGVISEVG